MERETCQRAPIECFTGQTFSQSIREAEHPYSSTDVCIWPYGKEDREMSPKLCSMEKSKNYLGMSDAPSPSPEMLLARCESLGDTAGLEQREPSAHPAIVRALGGSFPGAGVSPQATGGVT